MSDLNTALAAKYKNSFLKEVIDNVEEGDMVRMCMQCAIGNFGHFQVGINFHFYPF